jgi:hypothetical protein
VSPNVFHYTDTQAFKGVVEKAALWGTDFRYLNDSLELVYTWKAFIDKLARLSTEPGQYSEAYRAQLDALKLMNAIDLMAFDDAMFVACFTELPDAVSQWTRYGSNGQGLALGFDSERIGMLNVPQYHHARGGQLVPVTAIVADPSAPAQETVELRWGAFLQKVSYGDAARDRVVDGLIDVVERCCDTNEVGSFRQKVANCIFQTHALVHRLPLVKHSAFVDEQEHRITITEHFGGRSLSQMSALSSLGKPFSDFAQGALETVDVQFRLGSSTMYRPYVELPFDRAALVKVVTGPAVKHQLVEPTVRRILDRNGFRDTVIEASQSPFQS